MSLRLHCDGCDLVAGELTATWLTLGRRGSGFSLFKERDPDEVLGDGLTFHSYDCLRTWLMVNAEAST